MNLEGPNTIPEHAALILEEVNDLLQRSRVQSESTPPILRTLLNNQCH